MNMLEFAFFKMVDLDLSDSENMFYRQNNQKALKKRWVDFDGNDLRYYKPNDKVCCWITEFVMSAQLSMAALGLF